MEKIFLLIGLPVIGEISTKSKLTKIDVCQKCGISREEYSDIIYVMDSWGGEDLFIGRRIFYASESLKYHFEREGIKGVQFEKIVVKKGPDFYFREGAGTQKLPSFYRMIINGRADGPETWWQRVNCPDCEKQKWKYDMDALESGMELMGKKEVKIIPRDVFYSSWNGDDLFFLQDPEKTPIITEKALNVLLKLNVPKMYYRETNWIK